MSYIGTKKIKSVYIGTQKVKSVYVGTSKVYSSGPAFDGLCFTAEQSGSTVSYNAHGAINTTGIYYSRDGLNWTQWTGTVITLSNVGDKIYVKNNNNKLSLSPDIFFNFNMTGLISASGNCNSIINFSELKSYCFYRLFYNCTSLTTPPQLPATTLASICYGGMFYNCTSLTTAPQLPATTLAATCYYQMFYNCTSLTTAPQLPATTLAANCYYYMFCNCTSLTTPPQLPATTLADNCYLGMFAGCTSLFVSDTQTASSLHEWRIPSTNTFDNTITLFMFFLCLGTRENDNLVAVAGQSKTYYTQNQPV